jgi:hypothetical protein
LKVLRFAVSLRITPMVLRDLLHRRGKKRSYGLNHEKRRE